MKIADASNIYVGSSQVSKIMLGTTKIWPNVVPTNVTSDMTMCDLAALKSLNNLSFTGNESYYSGTLNIGNNGKMGIAPPSTEILVGGVSHDHIYFYSDGSIRYNTDTVVTFKNKIYTKIVWKQMYSNSYRNISGYVCSAGSITYDAAADEYVWTGNSNNFTIKMNNTNGMRFYYLYFK